MATPYVGQISIVSFGFAPKGFALCNGQVLPINQNQALFSLLGTTYGGDGQTTFALPNLQGASPIHTGGSYLLGNAGGEVNHTLTVSEMPAHTHVPNGDAAAANVGTPTNGSWAMSAENPYAPSPSGPMLAATTSNAGGGQSHPNLQPYLVINFVIALQGIFPSRN